MMLHHIAPRSAAALILSRGERLTVIDPEGEQVSDLVAFNRRDTAEYLLSGRSIDYASSLFLTTGNFLYSNRSVPMMEILADDVGRHDFTLTPYTFRILYGDRTPHHGCQGNLERVLAQYEISADAVPIAFNIFMHVAVDSESGRIDVRPPLSKPGDRIVFEARMDLIVALTACSAGPSNNFRFKPIDYEVRRGGVVGGIPV